MAMYDDPFTQLPQKRRLGDPNIPQISNPIGGGTGGPAPSGAPPGGWPAWMKSTTPGGPGGRPPSPYGAAGVGGPSTQTFGPGNNLINTQFNPTASGRAQGARGMTDDAAQAYANGGMPQFTAMTPINTSSYSQQLGAAGDMAGQMSLPTFGGIGATNYGATRTMLGQANAGPSSALQGLAGPGAMGGGFAYSGDTRGVRGKAMEQLDKVLADDTNRGDLSAQAYQLMLERAQPGEAMEDRRLAQKTAALGRTRSGMFNSEQMDMATSRERTRDQARRELSMSAASQALADRQSKLDAARGLSSELAGQDTAEGGLNLSYMDAGNRERGAAFSRMSGMEGDTFNRRLSLADREAGMAERTRSDMVGERDTELGFAESRNRMLGTQSDMRRRGALDQYGIDSDNYDRGRTERDRALDVDEMGENRRRNRLGDISRYSQGIDDQERSDRAELRGERGYQYGMDRDAQGDAVQQYEMEQDALDRRFRRGQGRYSLGQASDPERSYRESAGDYGADADAGYGAAADLLGSSARRRRLGQGETDIPNRFPGAVTPQVDIPEFDLDAYAARRRRA